MRNFVLIVMLQSKKDWIINSVYFLVFYYILIKESDFTVRKTN